MNRLEKLRELVDVVVLRQEDPKDIRFGFVHLYGVADLSALLAVKRGLDPELAAVAGMLHDIYTYRTHIAGLHGHNGAEDARILLRDCGGFSGDERQVICTAIFRHRNKGDVDGPYDELLKDANVLHHYLYNTRWPVLATEGPRLQAVLSELRIEDVAVEIDQARPRASTSKKVEDRRTRLADIAGELAQKGIVGRADSTEFLTIVRYFPDDDPLETFRSGWCAAFVYHCCMEAGFALPIKYPDPVPCRFAAVKAWLVWAQLPETGFYHPVVEGSFSPQRGDLVIYDRLLSDKSHDHIGVVLDCAGGVLKTAEGNVENRSGIFERDARAHIQGFIRIPNDYDYREALPRDARPTKRSVDA